MIRADCTIAVSLEEPSILQDRFEYRYEERHPGIPRVSFFSPLLAPGSTFACLGSVLGIHPTTAWILDEVRVLIEAAFAMPPDPTPQRLKEIQTTASELHNRISRLPVSGPVPTAQSLSDSGAVDGPKPLSLLPTYPDFSPSDSSSVSPPPLEPPRSAPPHELDPLYTAVRLSAVLYTNAVATLRPLSEVCSEEDALAVLMASWRIPLARWRSMLGIFVWIMLSIVPTVHQRTGSGRISAKVHTRFAKSILQCGWMQMSLENWAACEGSMQGALCFQRWLQQNRTNDERARMPEQTTPPS